MEEVSLALSVTSLLVAVFSIIVSIVFFVYANRAAKEAGELTNRIDLVVTSVQASLNGKNARDEELMRRLVEKGDRITENVVDRLLQRVSDSPGAASIQQDERRVMKEELVEFSRSSLKQYVESELVSSLEEQRNRILQAITEIEQKIKNKGNLTAADKEGYEQLAWKLRQDLDDVKQRIKAITGHT